MENNISFTGIKNIASVKFQREGFRITKNLSMVLTDDFNGKDLQEFNSVLNKITSDKSLYKNPEYPDVLNLECIRGGDNRSWISVNGTVLECEKDIPMFSYIAKLTRRIANMPEKNMIINDVYKNYAAKDTLIYGVEMENYENLVKDGFVDKMFDKQNAKNAAIKLNLNIQKIMNKYFGIS